MGNFNLDALQKNLGMDGLNMDDADFNLKKTVEETVIEDVIVLNAGKKNKVTVPEGYEKLDGDLNQGAGGDYIYLAVKRGTDKAKAVNGLAVAVGKNSKAAAPAGFEKIDMDLNKGAGGKYIYLCKRKGQEGAIRDIKVISADKANPPAPNGYKIIGQDLNEGAGGKYIYVCYM